MPVWVSTDPAIDVNRKGERRRHISADCPTYLAEVPTKDRSPAKGRPNTVKLQETTVRCEHKDCWDKWEQDQKAKGAKKGSTAAKTTASGAATTPAQKVGGKAADLAAKAAAARQKPPVAAGA